jgi:hypothetical protein
MNRNGNKAESFGGNFVVRDRWGLFFEVPITDSVVNGLSSGFLTLLPGVRGALPQTLRSALSLFTKAHAGRTGAEAAYGTSLQMFGSAGYQLFNSYRGSSTAGAAANSGGGNQGSKSQSSGNAVSTWMGSFNPFSPR